jgi:hypothetical protein
VLQVVRMTDGDSMYVFERLGSIDGEEPQRLSVSVLDPAVYTAIHHVHRLSQGDPGVTADEQIRVIELCLSAGRFILQSAGQAFCQQAHNDAIRFTNGANRLGKSSIRVAESQAREAAVLSGQGYDWLKDAACALTRVAAALCDVANDDMTEQPHVGSASGRFIPSAHLTRRQLALLCAVRQIEGLDQWAWSRYIQQPKIHWFDSIIAILRGSRQSRDINSRLQADVYRTYEMLISQPTFHLLEETRSVLYGTIAGPETGISSKRSNLLLCYLLRDIQNILRFKEIGYQFSSNERYPPY